MRLRCHSHELRAHIFYVDPDAARTFHFRQRAWENQRSGHPGLFRELVGVGVGGCVCVWVVVGVSWWVYGSGRR